MSSIIYEDVNVILEKLATISKIFYLHEIIDEQKGFYFIGRNQRYELIRTAAVIRTLSDPKHLVVMWTFTDLIEKTNKLVHDYDIPTILQFIEDKYGRTIDELSLGHLTYT